MNSCPSICRRTSKHLRWVSLAENWQTVFSILQVKSIWNIAKPLRVIFLPPNFILWVSWVRIRKKKPLSSFPSPLFFPLISSPPLSASLSLICKPLSIKLLLFKNKHIFNFFLTCRRPYFLCRNWLHTCSSSKAGLAPKKLSKVLKTFLLQSQERIKPTTAV